MADWSSWPLVALAASKVNANATLYKPLADVATGRWLASRLATRLEKMAWEVCGSCEVTHAMRPTAAQHRIVQMQIGMHTAALVAAAAVQQRAGGNQPHTAAWLHVRVPSILEGLWVANGRRKRRRRKMRQPATIYNMKVHTEVQPCTVRYQTIQRYGRTQGSEAPSTGRVQERARRNTRAA